MRQLYSDSRDFFIENSSYCWGIVSLCRIREAGLKFVAWLKRGEDFPRSSVNPESGVRPSSLISTFASREAENGVFFGSRPGPRAKSREPPQTLIFPQVKGDFKVVSPRKSWHDP